MGAARDRRRHLRRRSRTRRASIAFSRPGRRRAATARCSSSPGSTPRACPIRRPASRSPGGSSREAYRRLLLRSKLFVTAPRREDHGIAQLEALADGCLLVTTPAPGPYAALPIARELDPRLVSDDLAGAIRAALDEPAPRYVERSIPLLEPFTRAAVDRVVETELLPRLLG